MVAWGVDVNALLHVGSACLYALCGVCMPVCSMWDLHVCMLHVAMWDLHVCMRGVRGGGEAEGGRIRV